MQPKNPLPHAAILGGGSFGTALAIHLEPRIPVKVWEFMPEQVRVMKETRFCPLLPKARIPHSIHISNDLGDVLPKARFILIAVPSHVVVKTIEKAIPLIEKDAIVVLCSKGMDKETRSFLSEEIQQRWKGQFAVLCGPTHAEEVSEQKQTIAVVASKDPKVRSAVSKIFSSPHFHLEESDDVIGVQLCSSLKNIYAIWMGVLDGMNSGDNTKAMLSTFALREMKSIALSLGARPETIDGPAGVGDFIVTCLSRHSRNRFLGEQLGKGINLKDALAGMRMIAEGVTSHEIMSELLGEKHIRAPFIEGLSAILKGEGKAHAVFDGCVKASITSQ